MKLRNELGDGVAEAVGKSECAAGIANRGARRHGSEGDNLRDVVIAIASPDIVQDIVTAIVGEVHINIGHGNTLRIEEPFEEQVILNRIHVGDAGQVGDEATGSASSSGSYDDAFSFRPVDEVLNDQEVGGETGFLDDAEFVFHARAMLISDVCAEAFGKSRFAELSQIDFGRFVVRHIEMRELCFAEPDSDVAAIGDSSCIFNGFGNVFEERCHVFRRTKREIEMAKREAIFVGDFFVVANAQENVLQVAVFGVDIVHVVCRDERNARFSRNLDESGIGDHLILIVAMRLEFEEEIAFSKNRFIAECRIASALFAAGDDKRGHFAGNRPRERDDSFVIFQEEFLVDAGFVVESLNVRLGNDFHEILVAGLCFGEEDEIGTPTVFDRDATVHIRCHVDFRADNRLHVPFFRLDREFDRAIERGVVGESERGHAELLSAIKKRVDASGRREKAIVRVNVKVSERHAGYAIRKKKDVCDKLRVYAP